MSCVHRGTGKMVYCMAGIRLLGTERREILYGETHLVKPRETKSYSDTPDICRAAVPTGSAKQKGVPRRSLRLAASVSSDEGKHNTRVTLGCCGAPCCRAS